MYASLMLSCCDRQEKVLLIAVPSLFGIFFVEYVSAEHIFGL